MGDFRLKINKPYHRKTTLFFKNLYTTYNRLMLIHHLFKSNKTVVVKGWCFSILLAFPYHIACNTTSIHYNDTSYQEYESLNAVFINALNKVGFKKYTNYKTFQCNISLNITFQ